MCVERGPNAEPHINWNHCDGPLLTTTNGVPHWLTLVERVKFRFGLTSIEDLNVKYNR